MSEFSFDALAASSPFIRSLETDGCKKDMIVNQKRKNNFASSLMFIIPWNTVYLSNYFVSLISLWDVNVTWWLGGVSEGIEDYSKNLLFKNFILKGMLQNLSTNYMLYFELESFHTKILSVRMQWEILLFYVKL